MKNLLSQHVPLRLAPLDGSPIDGKRKRSGDSLIRSRLRRVLCGLCALYFSLASGLSPVFAQDWGHRLPDLGDVATGALSPLDERRIGARIMQDLRARDPAYLEDPDVREYLRTLGQRLVAASDRPEAEFQFFALRDPSINAFALPGGYIGVHTGLMLLAESESELAGVLGHEIAHVTQRHIAQLIGQQGQASMVMLASLLVAVLAAGSNSQVSEAALAAGHAGALQAQLGYSRTLEHEADRIGLQILEQAGFDVRGMPSFFQRLHRSTRVLENHAPAYLRTHPLGTQRLADLQGRVDGMRYRQVLDSADFALVRARLRATQGLPAEAITEFQRSEVHLPLTRTYGLALAHLRNGQPDAAARLLDALPPAARREPMVVGLAADVAMAQGRAAEAVPELQAALDRHPARRALRYRWIEALLAAGDAESAARVAREAQARHGEDARFWQLAARSEAALGQRSAQHRSQAEYHALEGRFAAAVEQLEFARAAATGDFHQLSAIDARLRILKERLREDLAEQSAWR